MQIVWVRNVRHSVATKHVEAERRVPSLAGSADGSALVRRLGLDVSLSAGCSCIACAALQCPRCRYWERKKLECAAQDRRLLGEELDMGEWILGVS